MGETNLLPGSSPGGRNRDDKTASEGEEVLGLSESGRGSASGGGGLGGGAPAAQAHAQAVAKEADFLRSQLETQVICVYIYFILLFYFILKLLRRRIFA